MKAVFKEGAKTLCLEWLTSSLENLQFSFSKEEKLVFINLIVDAQRFEVVEGLGVGSYSMIIPKESLNKLNKKHTGKFPLREEWIEIIKSRVEEDYLKKVRELL